MKKFLALALALVMVLALAACGGGSGSTNNAANNSTAASGGSSSSTTPSGGSAPADTGSAEEAPNAADLVSPNFLDPRTQWGTYDDLIAQIKSETDFARRAELMHDAEDILMATNCVIPLYYYTDKQLYKDYVKDVYTNPFGTIFFMYASMDNGSDTLRMNLASEPDFLDPALNSSVDGACLAANSFSGLYSYNASGKTEPACAEGYTTSDDGLIYTVTLKEGLKWSDGSDLTADDFVYSWKRAAATETAADYGYMFAGIKGYPDDLAVSAPDARTFVFELDAPCAYMEDLMAFPTFFPVKQSEVEAFADWKTTPGGWCQEAGFVSNGAYVCTAWNHDTGMTYEKNPYWYDADKVNIDKLEMMLSADDTAIYAAYNAGDIDFARTVPNDEIATLLNNPEFHVNTVLGTYYVAFNSKSSIFDDKTPEQAACMREAFTILIDRDYITSNISQCGEIPANAFIPINMADGNGGLFKDNIETQGYYDPFEIVDDYDGTVERARTLLKAAGYQFDDNGMLSAETPIQLEYLTNQNTGHVAVAESIQQDLAVLGIELTIQQQDWAVFLQERKQGNFDFAREGWYADFNDPINMLEMWITDSGNNDCQFGR